jgi:hypothetical protein
MEEYIVKVRKGNLIHFYTGNNWTLSAAEKVARELKESLKSFTVTVEMQTISYETVLEL